MTQRTILLAAVLALAAASAAGQHHGSGAATGATPYAGLHQREIKALSPDDTRALLEGRGMSLALAAELNGYPGPMHVLEHAQALHLSGEQRERTQALMHAHKAEARTLGERVVAAEQALDAAFAGGSVTPEAVVQHTARIGELQAQLRAAHLRTHLQQTALLTREQVAHYQQLRGYAPAAAGAHR
jgi:hypothetical protein